MKLKSVLKSRFDASVNFVFDNDVEARLVQRTPDYFIIYVSSHTGCNKACRFCHLTQSKQTTMTSVDPIQYIKQVDVVVDYYIKYIKTEATKVHVNFMSRGDALANEYILNSATTVIDTINKHVNRRLNIHSVCNISTILPSSYIGKLLKNTFADISTDYAIYYSMYSVSSKFRKRWLPKAMCVHDALPNLKQWQEETGKELVFHHAFIKGENDSIEEVEQFLSVIKPYNFNSKFNLVRYNPYSELQGTESDEDVLQRNFKLIANEMRAEGTRIVPRVGMDVFASCGMFSE